MTGPSFPVAIIGGGASGVLTAAQLHRNQPDRSVALIDPTGTGRGLAYSTPYDVHLLNVPARNMSAFPDQPEHFYYWLRQVDPWAAPGTFAPRKVYGDYLNHILEQACRSGKVERVMGTAVAVERGEGPSCWRVTLEGGERLEAETVILALGNLPPARLRAARGFESTRFVNDPWESGVLGSSHRTSPDSPILLIGTGLTAIDIILALRSGGHTGPIHALSRRGLLPRAHAPCHPHPLPDDIPVDSPLTLLRWIRREIPKAELSGSNWRAVIDALRPHTQRIWSRWNESERRRFLRHARAWWEVHRHRAAPQIAASIEAELAGGALRVHRGRIESIAEEAEGLVVRWRTSGSPMTLVVDQVFNCTGPDADYARLEQPLVAQMRGTGLLVPDRLGLSIETDEQGRILDRSGRVIRGLWAVGPLRKALLWESTAMPEIRVQAEAMGRSADSQ